MGDPLNSLAGGLIQGLTAGLNRQTQNKMAMEQAEREFQAKMAEQNMKSQMELHNQMTLAAYKAPGTVLIHPDGTKEFVGGLPGEAGATRAYIEKAGAGTGPGGSLVDLTEKEANDYAQALLDYRMSPGALTKYLKSNRIAGPNSVGIFSRTEKMAKEQNKTWNPMINDNQFNKIVDLQAARADVLQKLQALHEIVNPMVTAQSLAGTVIPRMEYAVAKHIPGTQAQRLDAAIGLIAPSIARITAGMKGAIPYEMNAKVEALHPTPKDTVKTYADKTNDLLNTLNAATTSRIQEYVGMPNMKNEPVSLNKTRTSVNGAPKTIKEKLAERRGNKK